MGDKISLAHIDISKGIGVLAFIVWHVFENFHYPNRYDAELYRFVFFVTGYFVFSSGYIIGSYYLEKLKKGQSWEIGFKRIFVRALKLLIIVLLANTAMAIRKSGHITSYDLVVITQKIISLLYVDRWDISLQVLLVIAATIVLGQILLYWFIKKRSAYLLSSIVLCFIFAIDYLTDGVFYYFWRYLLVGVTGVLTGAAFHSFFYTEHAGNTKFIFLGVVAIFLFSLFLFFTSISKAYYFIVMHDVGLHVAAVLSGFVGINILLYFKYDEKKKNPHGVMGFFRTVGQYSLMVYLLQIILINLFSMMGTPKSIETQTGNLLCALGIFAICLIFCHGLRFIRRYRFVNFVYGLVFQ